MKAIILAGGFAKRLWPLTKDTPKPLLDVGGKPIVSRIIDKVSRIDEVDEIIVSTNDKFGDTFREYLETKPTEKLIRLVVEPTMTEGEKLGSIGGLNYIMEKISLDDDVLIIGGDNLFEFDLKSFVDFSVDNEASAIALRKIEDKELIKKYGVCTVDKNNLLIGFEEKPKDPKSDLASTACYFFTFNDMMLVKEYLKEGNSPDAFGSFISWAIRKADIYAFVFEEEWFDIGSLEQLEEARKRYGD